MNRVGYTLGKAVTWVVLALLAVGSCCRGFF